jgi:hypothetical protein
VLKLPNEKKTNWRRRSWTYGFNLIILGLSLWAPGIDDDMRKYIFGFAFGNLALREKTQRRIDA